MTGSTLLDRRSAPERVADQAWRHLTSAVNSAGASVRDTARSVRRTGLSLTDDTGDLVGSAAEEARRRAVRAIDALAGRRALPWGLLIGATLVGVAIGWATATAARAAVRRDVRNGGDVEFVDIEQPNSPAGRDI